MFLKVLGLTILALYFIGVAIHAFSKFDDEETDFDFGEKSDKANLIFQSKIQPKGNFKRTQPEAVKWDLVQYSKRPHLPTSATGKIELEISETNSSQINVTDMITITMTLTGVQEKKLYKVRGKTPVLQYLQKHFQTKNLPISESKRKKHLL
jgi:hypothetical protein